MEIDMLGDAYEFLIGRFAANAGKKAGEFYTPQQVSKILAKIATLGKDKLRNVYDPTCGSGSLLLRDRKSTRLNSSHVSISYAVFCLKKKKKNTQKEARNAIQTEQHDTVWRKS